MTLNSSVSPNDTLPQAFFAGSISSSCCLLQLILNLLASLNIIHVGCAKFNTYLGPIRPYTRTITIMWLIHTWVERFKTSKDTDDSNCSGDKPPSQSKKSCCENDSSSFNCKKQQRYHLIVSTIICLVLMFMPEMLEFYRVYKWNQNEIATGSGQSRKLQDGNNDISQKIKKLEYVVDNMGCEGCINAVEGILNAHPQISKSRVVYFDEGRVDVYVDEDLLFNDEKGRKFCIPKATDADEKDCMMQFFENGVDELLQKDGYELRQLGWKTKLMKQSEKKKKGSVFQ